MNQIILQIDTIGISIAVQNIDKSCQTYPASQTLDSPNRNENDINYQYDIRVIIFYHPNLRKHAQNQIIIF